jgi:hypothetical protein
MSPTSEPQRQRALEACEFQVVEFRKRFGGIGKSDTYEPIFRSGAGFEGKNYAADSRQANGWSP